jgi:LuxR family maltose regulon positive regulatory protein
MKPRAADPHRAVGPDLKSAPAICHAAAFRREYVRSYLESSSGAPLVLVQAPAGYGKTTALSFFAHAEGSASRWVRLDAGDRSLGTMVVSLASAIYGWAVAPPVAAPDVPEAARWIVGGIKELAVTSIVLDDYETVAESDEVNALVEAVVERLPPFVRIVVGSEVAPPYLKRARLRQKVVELDASLLRFDADDVAGYIRNVHNYDISDAAASSVARRSGGCAAVVNLVGQLSHDLPRYLRVDFDALPLGPTEELMAPLLREVLARNHRPPARVARDLVRGDVGRRGGSTPADDVLDFLEERHCLAQLYAADPPVVVPHKLLRSLADRL